MHQLRHARGIWLNLLQVIKLKTTEKYPKYFLSFGRDPHFQMLAVMVLSQHRVSTSKTVSPLIPVGARCTGHVRMMCLRFVLQRHTRNSM